VREITPEDEQWSFLPVGYTADEDKFLATSDYRGNLTQLVAIDLNEGDVSLHLPELSVYEVDAATMNRYRMVLAVLINEDGYRTLRLYEADTLDPIEGPGIEKGIVSNIDFQGSWMLYSLNNARTPDRGEYAGHRREQVSPAGAGVLSVV